MDHFPTTTWTLVLAAGKAGSADEDARRALQRLCEIYWYPLYAAVRARGHSPEDALDLTQGFFTNIFEKRYLEEVRPDAGRFRSFLLASLDHYLSHERDRARAIKRGGGSVQLSLDAEEAETRYRAEPVEGITPEELFERRWGLTLIERALDRLRKDLDAAGRADEYEKLVVYLTGQQPRVSYREAGEDLGMSEGAVKTAVHRMRRRFGRLLREEISETVSKPEQVDDELRHLLSAVGILGAGPR